MGLAMGISVQDLLVLHVNESGSYKQGLELNGKEVRVKNNLWLIAQCIKRVVHKKRKSVRTECNYCVQCDPIKYAYFLAPSDISS